MAAFDAAISGPDAAPDLRLAAHQYDQLLHLLASADARRVPRPPAAAARRVFAHMLEAGAPPSEATITSLGRVVAADAEGADETFGLVSTMRQKYGLAPRLRSYSPVLAAFRRAGEAGKAYPVEAHMAASAVSPEEPEFAALLEVSAKVRDADKVYEYMHKLRRAVSCVTEETTEVLEGRFWSEKEATAGKAEWDVCQVKDALVANGGGCHQLGWLRTGPWMVQRVRVGADGECGGCGCRLGSVDIDMEDTQKFADSISGLALERETKANFSQFQLCAGQCRHRRIRRKIIRRLNVLYLRSRTHLAADTCPHASCFKYLLSWGNSLEASTGTGGGLDRPTFCTLMQLLSSL